MDERSVAERIADFANSLRITQVGPNDFQITAIPSASVMSAPDLQPIFGGRLTKKVFEVLPVGSYLHCNCCHRDGTPLLAETMGSTEDRSELWLRIRAMSLSGTKFYVYRDADAYCAAMVLQGRPYATVS